MIVRVGYRVLLPFVLLGLCILVIPVVHAEKNPDPDSALGMVVANINNGVATVLEPRHPATSDYYTLMEYGDHCAKRGDYKNALGYYNAALDRVEVPLIRLWPVQQTPIVQVSIKEKQAYTTSGADRGRSKGAECHGNGESIHINESQAVVRMPHCNSNLWVTNGKRSAAGQGVPGRDDPSELFRIAVC